MGDTAIQLIVGLGNPGPKYAGTRHNAGFWFVDALARDAGGVFTTDAKFFGEICRVDCGGHDVRLLKPDTFMNESGRSVQAVARFFKIPATAILVAYDEIDLPPGKVKLKKGGGHGGHNGLRDLMRHLDADFIRLRLGVGHPGHKDLVSNYVLSNPPREDEDKILAAMGKAIDVVPTLLGDGLQKATHQLHSNVPVPDGKNRGKDNGRGQSSKQREDRSKGHTSKQREDRSKGHTRTQGKDQSKDQSNDQSKDPINDQGSTAGQQAGTTQAAGGNHAGKILSKSGFSDKKKTSKQSATPQRDETARHDDPQVNTGPAEKSQAKKAQAEKAHGGLKEQLLALLKRGKK